MTVSPTTAVEFYRANGYLLPEEPLFTDSRLQTLKAIFEEMYARREEIGDAGFDMPHVSDSRLLDFLLDESVLDVVEPIIGPDIGLWSSHFIAKEPFSGKRTPWHEDSAYWKGKFDSFHGIVTVWLALDDVDRENGCMKVIPGTHRNGFSNYEDVDTKDNIFGSEIPSGAIDESKAVYFERNSGQYSLHDSRIIHGADANKSARRRAGYTMRYFATDMKFNPEAAPNHKLWLARGRNIAGNPVVNA